MESQNKIISKSKKLAKGKGLPYFKIRLTCQELDLPVGDILDSRLEETDPKDYNNYLKVYWILTGKEL